MNRRTLVSSAVILWLVAPALLWLGATRPLGQNTGRAEALPRELAGFRVTEDFPMTPGTIAALGTPDATHRRYHDGTRDVFIVAVYHEANWKSVHAPDTCLRGSNMEMVEDGVRALEIGGLSRDVGRLTMRSRQDGRVYLSLFAYVGPPDFVTGSYWRFFRHHAPRALFREPLDGCLLRAETWVVDETPEQAEARCGKLLSAMIETAWRSF
jgi:EpsI family protein